MKVTIANQAPPTLTGTDAFENLQPVEPVLIRKKELARRLSVSISTIDNWMSKKRIPYIRIGPRFCLFEFDAVFEAIKKHHEIKPVARG